MLLQPMIVGIDEAGRGPLAGAVIAAAVILNPAKPILGLTDSKLLTEKKRNYFYDLIHENALCVAHGRATVEEIDKLNILQATFLAMRRAFSALSIQPDLALIDGNQNPKLNCRTQMIIKGDLTEPAISAASIIAKVTRDREMIELDKLYPQYGFAEHKGYGTKKHLQALQLHGASVVHRSSFAPVTCLLENE